MADKQIKPSKGDYNALKFLVKEFLLKEFQAWTAIAKRPRYSGLPESPSGWERRLRRLISLGWVMRVRTGWYYILEEGYKVEEGQPF